MASKVLRDLHRRLIDIGYHQCPSCLSPTEQPNEHIEIRGSWCWDQTLPRCPKCSGPMEGEGDQCENCKQSQEFDDQWSDYLAVQQATEDELEALELQWSEEERRADAGLLEALRRRRENDEMRWSE